MWHITSNNVQRAKERLQLRRAEIETRYAEDKKALDAEFAVIETLEHAASEFMLKLNRENGAIPLEPTAPTDPPGGDEQDSNAAIVPEASQLAAPIDMPAGGDLGSSPEEFAPQPASESDQVDVGEIGGGLDILNPDRAGGSTAVVVRLTLKASPATLPPAPGESPAPIRQTDRLRAVARTIPRPSIEPATADGAQLPSTLRRTRAFGFVLPLAPERRGSGGEVDQLPHRRAGF